MRTLDRVLAVVLAIVGFAAGIALTVEVAHRALGGSGHLLIPYEPVAAFVRSNAWSSPAVLIIGAALAVLGLVLLVAQKITKIDLLGGLALFGIALMIASAGLALAFQSDEAVKYRTTVIGLISAGLFLIDGLRGGNGLAIRLKNYLPYRGIDAGRLGIGMGLMGAAMAALNLIVALYTSTYVWLFYSTFADFVVSMALILIVFQYSQGKLWRETWPRYRPPPADEAV